MRTAIATAILLALSAAAALALAPVFGTPRHGARQNVIILAPADRGILERLSAKE